MCSVSLGVEYVIDYNIGAIGKNLMFPVELVVLPVLVACSLSDRHQRRRRV